MPCEYLQLFTTVNSHQLANLHNPLGMKPEADSHFGRKFMIAPVTGTAIVTPGVDSVLHAADGAESGAPGDILGNLGIERSKTRAFTWPKLPEKLHERQPWGRPGLEPQLCDVLADPLVAAIMQSDGVSRAALESVIGDAKRRLR
jgi:hypothetical protein